MRESSGHCPGSRSINSKPSPEIGKVAKIGPLQSVRRLIAITPARHHRREFRKLRQRRGIDVKAGADDEKVVLDPHRSIRQDDDSPRPITRGPYDRRSEMDVKIRLTHRPLNRLVRRRRLHVVEIGEKRPAILFVSAAQP